MLMRTDFDGYAKPLRPSLLSRAFASVSGLFETVEGYIEFRRQRRELLALDDRMLKDIGMSRSDIMRISPAPRRSRKWPT